MAEKRVSVRLAAVGGRQVRAELEGVGEAGSRGFGRLSREMEAANARLAAFSRRARIALSAAAAGVITALAAMTRATIQVATQTQQFAQVANTAPEAFQRWAGASRTVGIEQEKLADILKDVNDRVGDFLSTGGGPMADFFERVAPRVGVTADQFARLSGPEALQLYVDTLERAGLSQQEMTFYLEAMASDATRLLPLLRNGGAEMERLGAQADDLGAVLDASAIRALQRTLIALVGVGQVFEGIRNRIGVALAPAVEWMANAFVSLASEGGSLRAALDALIGNIGRLATYAATFVSIMAGRWVAGFVAAAVSVRGLTLQTNFVTKALVGLFGSDRFRLAVSADGSTFFDGLSVDNTNGIIDQPRLPRFKAYTNYDNYVGVGTWTKIGLNNTDYNDQGAFDAANNHFVAPVDGTYLFGATLLYKINASATARMRGRLVLNGTTEIRGSLGEISATHVSLATAIWLQTMVPLTAGDTVELQGYFRVADGYFAADHTSFWGAKIG